MEYRLVYKNDRETLFVADDDIDAVRQVFRALEIPGRVMNRKFYAAGAKAIYFKDRKVFPVP